MKLYVAYGSNLNVDQMSVRCPDATIAGVGNLKDYRLIFRGNSRSGVANIEPCPGQSVQVALWWISGRDERALDRYEGFPTLYTKKEFPLRLHGEHTTAMAYVMTGTRRSAPPSEYYLGVIAAGYEYFHFDMDPLMAAAEKAGYRRFAF